MNLQEVVSEITTTLGRPDKVADAKAAVNSAISFCCLETNFARDFDEIEVATPVPLEFAFSIALSEFERWRKFLYIRPVGRNKVLTFIDPAKAFSNDRERSDVYYVAGNNVIIKLCEKTPNLRVGYLQYPPRLVDDNDTHWTLEVIPHVIITRALTSLFMMIGNTSEADRLSVQFITEYASAARDLRLGQNYGR